MAFERDSNALAGLNLEGLGLEIGPSHSPIAAGLPGVECKVLDHSSQADLVRKYAGMGVDTSRIQPVDYVWAGERYLDLVGDTRFDWIIASHVIEHVPDIVGFLKGCAEVLKPGGIVSLVVPDKRATFDYYRPPTGLGPVVDAHFQRRKLSSPGAIAECEIMMAAWDETTAPAILHPIEHAQAMMKMPGRGVYHDVHAWVFTPAQFRLLIEDLYLLELLELRELSHGEAKDEFYIKLSVGAPGPGTDRKTLALKALDELAVGRAAPAGRVAELESQNAALKAELAALRQTLSWRVTAPLRAVRRGVG